MEEEWPSLGLDLEVQKEVAELEEEKEVENPSFSEGEEEWPSIKEIPRLELSQSKANSEDSKQKLPSIPVIENDSDLSSLGELRFQDE